MRFAALLAAVLVCVVATGAARWLVAMPPLVLIASALTLIWLRRTQARLRVPHLLAGAIVAFTLTAAPRGPVVTSGVRPGSSDDLFALLDRLDREPSRVLGTNATVTGEWTPADAIRPASVSRRVMTCCAADAVDVGLDVIPLKANAAPAGALVAVRGVVRSAMVDGVLRYQLAGAIISSR